MQILDFTGISQYYGCPLCGELKSISRKPPNIVLIAAQVMGVCPECHEKLENDLPIDSEKTGFNHFGKQEVNEVSTPSHQVNAVSDMYLEVYDDGEI